MGGQAVIEGVLMRSPDMLAVAVRRPDGRIVLDTRPFVSWTRRVKALGLPLVRGGVVLIESMVIGVQALNFSSRVAMDALEKPPGAAASDRKTKAILAGTAVFAFGFGLAVFFYLPLLAATWTGVRGGVAFNLVDGAVRMALFIAYLAAIRQWREIRRVFEYHGAEHMAIYAHEAGRPLDAENVRDFSTHHPRCGTSFLLMVVLVSILVFMPLGRPENAADRLVRFLCIPLIGGVSYEIIRLSSSRWGRWIGRILTAPGVWLQALTTGRPDDAQLEVALVALRAALGRPLESPVESAGA